VINSVLTVDAIAAADGTVGAFVNVSTVPPVMVRVTADHTALAIVAAEGTFGLFVRVSTVPPVIVRTAALHTAEAMSAAVGMAVVSVLVAAAHTAAGIPENCVSMLALANPIAARTLAAVRIAVPTVLSVATPSATDDGEGTAKVPVNSLDGPYTVDWRTLAATG
jgi:hypothetical protein